MGSHRDPEAASDDTWLLQPSLFTSVLPRWFPRLSSQRDVKRAPWINVCEVHALNSHSRCFQRVPTQTMKGTEGRDPGPRYMQSMWLQAQPILATQGKAVMADASTSRGHHTHGFYSCSKFLGASPRHWPHRLLVARGLLSRSLGGKTDHLSMICRVNVTEVEGWGVFCSPPLLSLQRIQTILYYTH